MSGTEPPPLVFRPLCDLPKGTISSLLRQSYSAWDSAATERRQWESAWLEYDEDIHRYPDTVGRSGFVSCLDNVLVGFGSWDPRPFPPALIGHNCIIPAFRGRAFGLVQLQHIIEVLRHRGFTKALARTGDIDFFAPARKMHETCGFVAGVIHLPDPAPRTPGVCASPFSLIEYQLTL